MSLISISRSLPDEWMVLANSICLPVRLPSGFLRQLVGEDQQAVERRAQLVRHVGQEFGLVLARSGPAAWPSLPGPGGPVRLRGSCVPLPAFCWASRRAFSCSSWLVCCSSSCWLCSSLGQRLRLLEQVFRAHVGFDGVEHDADRLGQLIEEGLVGRVEALERGQFHDPLTCAFEDDRQHDDVQRRGFAQAGGDADVVGRHVGEQDLLLLQGALADQPFAQLELVAERSCALGRRSWPAASAAACRRLVSSDVEHRRAGPRPPGPVRRGSAGRRWSGPAGPAACG